MEKIWLKNYPAGVPAEINPDQYQSIRDLFDEAAVKFGDRPAYNCMGKEISFKEAWQCRQARTSRSSAGSAWSLEFFTRLLSPVCRATKSVAIIPCANHTRCKWFAR